MNFGIQIFGDMVLVLYGSEGMLDAAKEYCEQRDDLDLEEYIDWVVRHRMPACVSVRAGTKGLLRQHQAKKVSGEMNEQLELGGVYVQLGQFITSMKIENPELYQEARSLFEGEVNP